MRSSNSVWPFGQVNFGGSVGVAELLASMALPALKTRTRSRQTMLICISSRPLMLPGRRATVQRCVVAGVLWRVAFFCFGMFVVELFRVLAKRAPANPPCLPISERGCGSAILLGEGRKKDARDSRIARQRPPLFRTRGTSLAPLLHNNRAAPTDRCRAWPLDSPEVIPALRACRAASTEISRGRAPRDRPQVVNFRAVAARRASQQEDATLGRYQLCH